MKNALKIKGHLLPSDLYHSLLELNEKEEYIKKIGFEIDQSENELVFEEYFVFRKQLISKFTFLQSKLTRVLNNGFEKRVNAIKSGGLFSIIVDEISVIMAYLTLLIIIFLPIYIDVSRKSSELQLNPLLAFLGFLFFMFMLVISAIGFANIGMGISKVLWKTDVKESGDLVKKSGKYKCVVCGKTMNQYKNTWFTYCNHEDGAKILKKFFLFRYWKFDSELVE